jgi:hypothetical protein
MYRRESSFTSIDGIIYATSSTNSTFSLNNLTVRDIYINGETSIIKIGAISRLYFEGITVKNTIPLNLGDENTLIDLNEISSTSDSFYSISSINISQSEITMIRIDNTYQSKFINQTIIVSNVLYRNTFFEFAKDLLVTASVKSSNTFMVEFKNISFADLNFKKGGNLMLLQHQSPNQFTFEGLTITNVTN